jgi:hypothetical protein
MKSQTLTVVLIVLVALAYAWSSGKLPNILAGVK